VFIYSWTRAAGCWAVFGCFPRSPGPATGPRIGALIVLGLGLSSGCIGARDFSARIGRKTTVLHLATPPIGAGTIGAEVKCGEDVRPAVSAPATAPRAAALRFRSVTDQRTGAGVGKLYEASNVAVVPAGPAAGNVAVIVLPNMPPMTVDRDLKTDLMTALSSDVTTVLRLSNVTVVDGAASPARVAGFDLQLVETMLTSIPGGFFALHGTIRGRFAFKAVVADPDGGGAVWAKTFTGEYSGAYAYASVDAYEEVLNRAYCRALAVFAETVSSDVFATAVRGPRESSPATLAPR